ncbi:MAG: DUF559 domain-containing protein [Cryobacterium sp.]|nr:DUF559 domain-containing protein [Cryobacterium sp.]
MAELKYDRLRVNTRRQLLARGWTPRRLAADVHSGRLIRIRRGYYAVPSTPATTLQAVRVGGLLTCVSAARNLGIWSADSVGTHVNLRHEASRMRTPDDRFTRLTKFNRAGCVLHWTRLIEPHRVSMESVGVLDCLAEIIRCQPKYLAIAAIDSALNQGIVRLTDVKRMFRHIPRDFQSYLQLVDTRAMSGIETITRLLVQEANFEAIPQVRIEGVGRVDLLVDGCVVIETDGRLGHEDIEGSLRDYDRDVKLAIRGFSVLRFNYWQVMETPDLVVRAVSAALYARRFAKPTGVT